MLVKLILLFSSFLLITISCSGTRDKTLLHSIEESKSERISIVDFDKKIQSYFVMLTSPKDIDIEILIDICKVYNTIGQISFDGCYKEFYTAFRESFLSDMLPFVVRKLEMDVSLGMGYYSKKYDISIGGLPNEDSYYIVEY